MKTNETNAVTVTSRDDGYIREKGSYPLSPRRGGVWRGCAVGDVERAGATAGGRRASYPANQEKESVRPISWYKLKLAIYFKRLKNTTKSNYRLRRRCKYTEKEHV